MFTIGCMGICFNLISFVVYLRQKCHKTFHRLTGGLKLIPFVRKTYLRLLFLLVIIDTIHLVTSLLSFSLPTLSQSFLTQTYLHTLPYTLPLAQVTALSVSVSVSVSVFLCLSLSLSLSLSVTRCLGW